MSNVTRRLAPKVVEVHAVLTVLTGAGATITQPTAQPVSTGAGATIAQPTAQPVSTAVPSAQPASTAVPSAQPADPVQIPSNPAAMNANARAAALAAAAANPVPHDRAAMNDNDANQVPPATATAKHVLIGTWVCTHVKRAYTRSRHR